ncbi:hypothetical protein GCM10010251_61240 [Streptomyces aurantiogriseus]|uniref:Uncharacterized protein n=1 Tax=Streptomyces aurantiogriseus TaxID=66870 RepID=A0A918KW35_9ACTN|nr:hypothetical protein GCM10010251_61240 [Streptomyces aurantiogriseus]
MDGVGPAVSARVAPSLLRVSRVGCGFDVDGDSIAVSLRAGLGPLADSVDPGPASVGFHPALNEASDQLG